MSEEIKADLKRFFEILDIKEESEGGRAFSPVFISCVRAQLGQELDTILSRLKVYANDT